MTATSFAAPSTSPVIPPNRRWVCADSAITSAAATATASGPCHGRPGTAATPATASAVHHSGATHAGCEPATVAPSPPGRAAGTPRRAHQANPARPVAAASAVAAIATAGRALSAASAAACVPRATTSATTANAPDPALAHHRERPRGRPVAAEAVGGVGQPVDVHAAGDQRQEPDGEQPGGRHAERRAPDQHPARGHPQQRPDDGRPAERTRRGTVHVRPGDPDRQDREPAQREAQPAQLTSPPR